MYHGLQLLSPDVSAAIALAGYVGEDERQPAGRARPLRNMPRSFSHESDLGWHDILRSEFRRDESSTADVVTVSVPDCDEDIPASDVSHGQAGASRRAPQEE